ncbi:MipA/OmpV family protein [Thalassococcus sp. BH17M4-6]|uniref:MipA/OmpV family protein n=1 Tax=Thalassococcus sp. BH17M4-6 TaxID=3413148 RepID=UPI003BD8CD6B
MSRLAFALLAVAATPALAAGPDPVEPQVAVAAPAPAPRPAFVFSLRGGVAANPAYFGSDETEIGPDLGFKFHFLRLPGGREFGNPDPWADTPGWDFHGALAVIGERDPNDHSELAGLDKVDTAVELGFGIGYTARNFEAFADVRRGFGGHEGYVLEAGADAVFRPSDRLKLTLGPRVLFGDDTYSDTYFGVSPAEASARLPAYDADGGLVSVGAELGMLYQINDVWGLEGAVTYDAFQNDAEDSPIVRHGSSDQWGIRFGLTRVFSLGG